MTYIKMADVQAVYHKQGITDEILFSNHSSKNKLKHTNEKQISLTNKAKSYYTDNHETLQFTRKLMNELKGTKDYHFALAHFRTVVSIYLRDGMPSGYWAKKHQDVGNLSKQELRLQK